MIDSTVVPPPQRLVSPPADADADAATAASPRRWLVLGILCLSVLVITLDGTIVNVALPSLVRELGATTSQLQWIVDAYTLVFAGLLLAAGSLGDRFGRKGALLIGMAWFGLFSGLGAFAADADQLIAARALMGVGAALIFPATLALLVNVFTRPAERAAAIAIWAATAGLSVALGPVTGGWLLEHFWWGSVFIVNVPIVLVAMVLIARFVPTSRDTHVQRFDPVGMVLSIAGVVAARVGRHRRPEPRMGLADHPRRVRPRRHPARAVRRRRAARARTRCSTSPCSATPASPPPACR